MQKATSTKTGNLAHGRRCHKLLSARDRRDLNRKFRGVGFFDAIRGELEVDQTNSDHQPYSSHCRSFVLHAHNDRDSCIRIVRFPNREHERSLRHRCPLLPFPRFILRRRARHETLRKTSLLRGRQAVNSANISPIKRWAYPFLALTLLFFLANCGRNSGPPELSHSHLSPTILQNEIVYNDSSLGLPVEAAIVGQHVVIADLFSDSAFHAVSTENGQFFMFGRRGSGPGEFQRVSNLDPVRGSDDQFWVYDARLNRMTLMSTSVIDVDQDDEDPRILNFQSPAVITGPLWIDSSTILSLGFFSIGRMAVFDSNGILQRTVGSDPPLQSEEPPTVAQQAYLAALAPHPSRSKLVSATRYTSLLEIFNGDGSTSSYVDGPLQIDLNFSVHSTVRGPAIAFGSDARVGYLDVSATNDYIYALFSGRTDEGFPGNTNKGRFVHIFDWDGQFERALELDADVFTIVVDSVDRFLYATQHNPEPALLRFEIR